MENLIRSRIYSLIISLALISLIFGCNDFDHDNLNIAQASSDWTQNTESNFKNGSLSMVEIYNYGDDAELRLISVESDEWIMTTQSDKPTGRTGHVMASVFGTTSIVLFGGTDDSGYLDDTWVYDLKLEKWSQKIPSGEIPAARTGHAMAAIHGTDKLILFGGFNDTYLDDTWIYDLSEDSWTELWYSNRPDARAYHAMSSIYKQSKVLLFGGFIEDGYEIKDTWLFDFSSMSWIKKYPVENPPERRAFSMAPIYNTDKVIIFGGWSMSLKSDTWIYDVSDYSWERIIHETSGILIGRQGHAMDYIFAKDQVVMFGGYDTAHNYNDETWVYDLNDNIWTKKTQSSKPTGRTSSKMVSVWAENKIVLFGGRNNDGFLDETWIYVPYKYAKEGFYTSPVYDAGSECSFKRINYNCTKPEGTNIKFQIRIGATKSGLLSQDFLGPDGNSYSYYKSSGSEIWSGHNGDRWVQYKVYMSTTDDNYSPSLKNFTIVYNNLPIANQVQPSNNTKISHNKINFQWDFIDLDFGSQTGFQVIIDNDINFSSIDYDSGEQNSAVKNWQFPDGTDHIAIRNGVWYWKIRIKDSDCDWGVFSQPWSFTVDAELPTSSILKPANNGFYPNLDAITGIASSKDKNVKIIKVEIQIKKLSDNYTWDGSKWGANSHWLITTGKSDWSFNSSLVPWNSGTIYQVQSRATDDCINIEPSNSGHIFNIDNEAPISEIEYPINTTWLNELSHISGFANDSGGSGIEEIEISIKQVDSKTYWYGTYWDEGEFWLSVFGNTAWSYDITSIKCLVNKEYNIRTRAIDKAGNIEKPKEGFTFIYDPEPPENLIITINNNNVYTTTLTVSLQLQAEDTVSGISQLAFSLNGINWTSWKEFNTDLSFNVTPGDGEKTVHFIVRDLAGNIAESVSDSIILDTKPPHSLSIEVNDGTTEVSSRKVRFKLSATDDTSGVHQISFSTDKESWTTWENYSITRSYTLPSGNGQKVIFFKVKDRAGNIANPVHVKITLKESTNDWTVFSTLTWIGIFIVVIIIFLFLTLFILKRRKHAQKKLLSSEPVVIKPTITTRPVYPQYPASGYMPMVQPQQTTVQSNLNRQCYQLKQQPPQQPQVHLPSHTQQYLKPPNYQQ